MNNTRHPFLNKVEAFIARHHLMVLGRHYLVALSGGADSVALLVALHQLGYNLACVHCNFHLRGEESNRDEEFCRNLCEEMDVAFHTAHFATAEYAQAHHVSIEMAARQLRYDYFERLRIDVGADDVVVAHHKDDAAETILLNFIRGTGIHGLTGIAPRNGHVVRPLLGVCRDEVEAFLRDGQWTYVTDSSNLVPDVVRNKIRLCILPLMRDINPSVTDALTTTAERLSQVATVFDHTMEQCEQQLRRPANPGRVAYDRRGITDEYTLFYILSRYGFQPSAIEAIFERLNMAQTGALFTSATHELLIDRDVMLIQPRDERKLDMKLPIEGKYVIDEQTSIRISQKAKDEQFAISRSPNVACLDAALVQFPLTLRTALPGDRFCPLGMTGSRLVSDFLTDLKMNRFDKRRQLVVADARQRIIWLVGIRPDHRFRITENTKVSLVIQLLSDEKG